MSKLFGVENFRRNVMKGDDKLMGAKMARRIAKLIRRKPDVLQQHPDWDKHKDADIKMQEAAQETKDRKRESNPGPVHEDTAQDDGTEKSKPKLNIGPKEGRVPSYGNHDGHPSGRAAPSLPLSTMGKSDDVDDPTHWLHDLPIFVVMRDIAVSEARDVTKGADGHVASVAVMHKNKILMGKRRDNNRWTLPGGHLEKDEDPHEGGIRELHEEAGIKATKLHHLKSTTIKTHTGKEKTIHAFKFEIPGEKPPKTSMKNDPDKEVHKWQWVVPVDGKLPEHIKTNLHSPKNAVLEEMGLMKARFYVGLQKSRPHKYIRKYKGKTGEWIYIYHEGDQHHKISEEDVAAHRHLAEHGDESERAHHAELVSRIQEMTSEDVDAHKMLAQHGDESERAHHTSILKHLGHKKEEKSAMERTILAAADRDDVDKDIEPAKLAKVLGDMKREIDKTFSYLEGHRGNPLAEKILAMNKNELLEMASKPKTVRDVMTAAHKIARKMESEQGELTSQGVGGEHKTYGQRLFAASLASLQSNNIVPESYAREHARQPRQAKHEVKPLKEHQARETARLAAEAERERRELGELQGSMAFHMASLMGAGTDRVRQAKELDRTIKQIFGKSLKKEDFPYNFEDKGVKTKITKVEVEGGQVTMWMQLTNAEGKPMMESFERSWNKRDGRPHIHNNYMKTRDDVRDGLQIGNLINQQQRKLMKSLPEGGTVTVYADLDVGGYCWAQQGFSFESSSELTSMRQKFQYFLQENGMSISSADLAHFKHPVHFAQFGAGGKKVIVETSGGDRLPLSELQKSTKSLSGKVGEHPLTAGEIARGETGRMAVHLGKKFLLRNSGYKWHGAWDSKVENDATKFADKYYQLRDRASEHLGAEYRSATERSLAGQSPQEATPRVERASLAGTSQLANSYIGYWRPRTGGNIRMSAKRIARVARMPEADRNEFLRLAPITTAAKRLIRQAIAGGSGG